MISHEINSRTVAASSRFWLKVLSLLHLTNASIIVRNYAKSCVSFNTQQDIDSSYFIAVYLNFTRCCS